MRDRAIVDLNSSDRLLWERVTANFVESYRILARLSPWGSIEESDGLTMVVTGIPMAYFNPTFVTRPLVDPIALADRLRRFYNRAGTSGMIIATDESARANAIPLVRASGLPTDDPLPMMLLSPLPEGAQSTSPGVEVRVVDDLTVLRLHNDLVAWDALRACFDDPAILALPDMTLYVGFIDGEPVGHALRFTSHRIAGIYNVGTHSSFRRRGVGTALTWRAALDGRAEGCLASALQSSPMAYSLYQSMGFRHITEYQTWSISSGSTNAG